MKRAFENVGVVVGLGAVVALAGCSSPLVRPDESAMREALLASHRRFLESVAAGPVVEVSRVPSDVEAHLTEARRAELDEMSGLDAYDRPAQQGPATDDGGDLLGRSDTPVVELSLERAIALAVRHNPELRSARALPGIARAALVQAEAAFDAAVFTRLDVSSLDRPGFANPLIPTFGGDRQSQTVQLTTGVRKPLASGGAVVAQTSMSETRDDPSTEGISPFYRADVLVGIEQPLLRGFGSDLNRANIVLARNATAAEREQLRATLITVLSQTEQAYWNLAFARQQLLIQEQLYQRTLTERNRLRDRLQFDVSTVRFTESNSLVELRRADVIRARQQWRAASDTLKRLLNAPELPLADEVLLRATDAPADAPVAFSLLDTVTTALERRPELQRAVLDIQDASVRQRVADRLRLPQLDLTATVQLNGFDGDDVGGAYGQVSDADYIDYVLGLDFEYALGNRAAEGLALQRQLERQRALSEYQRVAQDVVLEVKNAMRSIVTQYELIGAARAARRAAADNLRAIQEQERAGVALTPEFLLDLKLRAQERLADAEAQEARAAADYMIALSDLFAAMGTIADRNGVAIELPVE